MFKIINKRQIFGKLNQVDQNILYDELKKDGDKLQKSKKDIEFFDEDRGTINIDDHNDSKIQHPNEIMNVFKITPLPNHNKAGSMSRRFTNPNQPSIDNHTIVGNESEEEIEDEYFADDLVNYNVTPEEIKNHFNFLFINQDDLLQSKRTVKRNTAKTIQMIKQMKMTQHKLKMYLNLKKPTWRSPRKKTIVGTTEMSRKNLNDLSS